MPSYAAIAPIAQHRGREPQLACDLHQWPTAACQQGDRLRLELVRKMTPFLAHSTPSRSRRSLAKVSTNAGEAHDAGLSAAEREELIRLRRENKQLRLERDILSRATAWFARETGVIPSRSSGS